MAATPDDGLANVVTVCLPVAVAVLYAATGVAFVCKRDWAWALVWFSYAVANVGLLVAGNR